MLELSEDRELDGIARRLRSDTRRQRRRDAGTAAATGLGTLGVVVGTVTVDPGTALLGLLVATAGWMAFILVRRPRETEPT